MKREAWQHAAVRLNRTKLLRIADKSAAAAPNFTGAAYARAPSNAPSRGKCKCRRPRCAGCHDHPAAKSKGAHKLRACDVALNHRLVSWRVVDGAGSSAGVPDYKGASASAVLAYLAGGSSWHQEEDDDESGNLETSPPAKAALSDLYDLIVGHRADAAANYVDAIDADAIEEKDQDTEDEEEEEEDMGFCMVGITIAVEFSDGEEDWIVVEEIPSI